MRPEVVGPTHLILKDPCCLGELQVPFLPPPLPTYLSLQQIGMLWQSECLWNKGKVEGGQSGFVRVASRPGKMVDLLLGLEALPHLTWEGSERVLM